MWNKIKSSLLIQLRFLFIISCFSIFVLWGFFFVGQKQKEYKEDMERYFKVARSLHPVMSHGIPIDDEMFSAFDMEKSTEAIPKDKKILFKKGEKGRGIEVFIDRGDRFLHLHSAYGDIILKDKKTKEIPYLIHFIFLFLLLSQALLYLKLRNSLRPLGKIHDKLQKLEGGDLSSLNERSEYKEITSLIDSYNNAVSRLKGIIDTREMFNKVFMHEMKMPLAKGMFYLKLEPSSTTHEKLGQILSGLDAQLDQFSRLENMFILQQSNNQTTEKIATLLKESIEKSGIEATELITLQGDEEATICGDKELWKICFKNLIENGAKYATDRKLFIRYDTNSITFTNRGEPLPLQDADASQWRIDKSKRHKSSSGFGFGLFIIKAIASLQGYAIRYDYDQAATLVKIEIIK